MPRYVQPFRYHESSAETKAIVLDLYEKLIEFEKQFVSKDVSEKFDTKEEVKIIADSLEMVFILLDETKPIGILGSDSVSDGCISMLYVEPEYRQTGAGSRLIHAFKNRVPNELKVFCVENNAKALAFYKKKGFVFEETACFSVVYGTHPNN